MIFYHEDNINLISDYYYYYEILAKIRIISSKFMNYRKIFTVKYAYI